MQCSIFVKAETTSLAPKIGPMYIQVIEGLLFSNQHKAEVENLLKAP